MDIQAYELTTGDVAQLLNCHENTVRGLGTDNLPHELTEGGHRRYRVLDVIQYLRKQAPAVPVNGPPFQAIQCSARKPLCLSYPFGVYDFEEKAQLIFDDPEPAISTPQCTELTITEVRFVLEPLVVRRPRDETGERRHRGQVLSYFRYAQRLMSSLLYVDSIPFRAGLASGVSMVPSGSGEPAYQDDYLVAYPPRCWVQRCFYYDEQWKQESEVEIADAEAMRATPEPKTITEDEARARLKAWETGQGTGKPIGEVPALDQQDAPITRICADRGHLFVPEMSTHAISLEGHEFETVSSTLNAQDLAGSFAWRGELLLYGISTTQLGTISASSRSPVPR